MAQSFQAHREARDDGAVAIISAIMLATLCGFSALAVDVGSLYLTRRHLQAATDAAALAGTYGYPVITSSATSATTFAKNYLGYNGYPAARLTSTIVTPGRYCPTAGTSPPTPGTRFTPTTDPASTCAGDPAGISFGRGPNAVQVTASTNSPLYFGQVLQPGTLSEPVTTTATATQIDEAGFHAGTGLLNLGPGYINSVLTALLGSSVNLDLVSYNGLVNTDIKALSFFSALATQIGVSGGTYTSLLNSSASVHDVIAAEAAVLNQPNSIANIGADIPDAKNGLAILEAAASGSPRFQLSSLFDLGVWQNQGLGSTNPASALSAGLNLYDLATLSAQVANGSNALAVPSATIGIPGIATVSAAATAIEPPQSPPFAFGPVGARVHTAQIRVQLTMDVLQALSVLGGTGLVHLPIYVEVASGDAVLTGISCGLHPATDALVDITGTSAAATAYVGTPNVSTPISNFSTPVTVKPADLVALQLLGIGLVTVTGSATAAVSQGAPTPLVFNQTQIANATAQTVTSTGQGSMLLSALGPNLVIQAKVLGIPLLPGLTATISAALNALLVPVFAGLDPVADGLLAALGVKLGYMDVTATGVRCGVPALVL